MGQIVVATEAGADKGFAVKDATMTKDVDYVDPEPADQMLPTLAYLLVHGYAVLVDE